MDCRVIGLALAASLSMTIGEFIELQKLSTDELRARFSLPAGCDPAVTASTPDAAHSRLTVGVECRAQPPAQAPAPRPGPRTRP
ncbi:MAG TPA: hypothetical protein VHT71_20780 [Methylomirabilota bacterium]|jgi:hypothetical protein|nr:hypothetical protein [Methylomirabilota bacterium]